MANDDDDNHANPHTTHKITSHGKRRASFLESIDSDLVDSAPPSKRALFSKSNQNQTHISKDTFKAPKDTLEAPNDTLKASNDIARRQSTDNPGLKPQINLKEAEISASPPSIPRQAPSLARSNMMNPITYHSMFESKSVPDLEEDKMDKAPSNLAQPSNLTPPSNQAQAQLPLRLAESMVKVPRNQANMPSDQSRLASNPAKLSSNPARPPNTAHTLSIFAPGTKPLFKYKSNPNLRNALQDSKDPDKDKDKSNPTHILRTYQSNPALRHKPQDLDVPHENEDEDEVGENEDEDEDEDEDEEEDALVASQAPVVADLEDCQDNPYMVALRNNYTDLSKVIWKEQTEALKSLKGYPFVAFDDLAWDIFAATPTPLLLAVASGNLPQLYFQGKQDIHDCINMFKRTKATRHVPFIYLIFLCDNQGEGPSGLEWLKIAELLHKYTERSASDLAFAIDCIGREEHRDKRDDNRLGRRFYLDIKDVDDNLRLSTIRQGRVRAFARALRERAKGNQTTRLSAKYGGYALDFESLCHSHQNNPSSYLMALTHAIAQHLFPGKYRLKDFLISPILDPDGAPIGEIIVCALASCMFQTGEGFNIADPGNSVESVYHIDQHTRHWIDKWVEKHSPYYANLRMQVQMYENRQAESERLLAELKEVQEELAQETARTAELEAQITLATEIRLTRDLALLQVDFDVDFSEVLAIWQEQEANGTVASPYNFRDIDDIPGYRPEGRRAWELAQSGHSESQSQSGSADVDSQDGHTEARSQSDEDEYQAAQRVDEDDLYISF